MMARRTPESEPTEFADRSGGPQAARRSDRENAMTHSTIRHAHLALGALACALLIAAPAAALAQAWPSHTIQAVIPFAPGNANDVVGRIVLDQLSRQLG